MKRPASKAAKRIVLGTGYPFYQGSDGPTSIALSFYSTHLYHKTLRYELMTEKYGLVLERLPAKGAKR